MNHCIPRRLAASLLILAACALCSACARLIAAGHLHQSAQDIFAGRYEAAIAETTKAIEAKPDYHFAYNNRAAAYTYARRYDLAEQDFRRAIALEPEEAISHLSYVIMLVFVRREQEAAEHAERFLRSHPDSTMLKCGLAMALERSKDYSRAHGLASQCIAEFESGANPTEVRYAASAGVARLYGLHARFAARMGRKDEAWRSIEKASSIHDDFATRYSRASIRYIEGNWEQALLVLREADARAQGAEKDSTDGVESRFLLGQCYQQLGRWREAQGAYEEFVAANPSEKEEFANLGLVKTKLGVSESAVADFSRALEMDPHLLDARRNRGTAYQGQKRYEMAIQNFSGVLAEDGSDARTLYKRAYAYCTNGKWQLGAKDLRTLLRIEPKNDDVSALLRACAGDE
ncbi:MAG: tetratricopeptide repeat protein [Methylococcales bacterium]